MKILLNTLLLVLVVSVSFSQEIKRSGGYQSSKDANWLSPKVRDQRAIALPDGSVMQNLKDTVFPKSQLSNLAMISNPTVAKAQQDAYMGNNGEGFDMYRSHVDNMSVLKPDQSFSDRMPTDNAITNDRMNLYDLNRFNVVPNYRSPGVPYVKPSPKLLLFPR